MLKYITHRLILMIPTLFGIMLINFLIIQAAPGGPVQQILNKLKAGPSDITSHFGESDQGMQPTQNSSEESFSGNSGISPEFIEALEKQFGFDKPLHTRFFLMIKNYLFFDFGESYFKQMKVSSLIAEKLPVSISLGLWTLLLVNLIAIPLGIQKAVRNGSSFDFITSGIVIIAYAIPSFLFALFLITFFAGGGMFELFPLKGLLSSDFEKFTIWEKIKDYFWHLALPLTAMTMSGFAKVTLLTKNSFLEEINKQYVLTARAKGLCQRKILYGHIFKNALIVVLASAPSTLIAILFTSSLLIEVLFSLDGLGLLGFEAALSRDYPVMFGSLYMFTILGMFLHLIGDLMMMLLDRRLDFSQKRG